MFITYGKRIYQISQVWIRRPQVALNKGLQGAAAHSSATARNNGMNKGLQGAATAHSSATARNNGMNPFFDECTGFFYTWVTKNTGANGFTSPLKEEAMV